MHLSPIATWSDVTVKQLIMSPPLPEEAEVQGSLGSLHGSLADLEMRQSLEAGCCCAPPYIVLLT